MNIGQATAILRQVTVIAALAMVLLVIVAKGLGLRVVQVPGLDAYTLAGIAAVLWATR